MKIITHVTHQSTHTLTHLTRHRQSVMLSRWQRTTATTFVMRSVKKSWEKIEEEEKKTRKRLKFMSGNILKAFVTFNSIPPFQYFMFVSSLSSCFRSASNFHPLSVDLVHSVSSFYIEVRTLYVNVCLRRPSSPSFMMACGCWRVPRLSPECRYFCTKVGRFFSQPYLSHRFLRQAANICIRRFLKDGLVLS